MFKIRRIEFAPYPEENVVVVYYKFEIHPISLFYHLKMVFLRLKVVIVIRPEKSFDTQLFRA